jgi:hypothetical protein
MSAAARCRACEVGGGERRHVDGLEQAAVEPGDVVVAVVAAFLLHGGEELFDAAGGLVGVAAGIGEEAGEDAGGEQLFVFGEHAEQALDEEVGDGLPQFLPAPAHGGGELGELAGGLGGDGGGGFLRAQLFGVGEHPARSCRFPARRVRRCGWSRGSSG